MPIGRADVVKSAWDLPLKLGTRFSRLIGGIQDGEIDRFRPHLPTRTISLFIGLHVEAVPGECILPDVPEPLVGDGD